MNIMKIWIALGIIAVLASLTAAGYFMLQGSDHTDTDTARSKRMARALALRVGLSVAIFASLLLAHWLGWIQPSGWLQRG